MELLSIGKFAKTVGVTTTTLRRMHQSGELIPAHISNGGTRYYSTEQLKLFQSSNNERIVIGYCRVSTPSQKDDLETQVQNVKSYMYAKGYKFDIIKDIGSGINYKKKGFELIEYLCEINNVEIEVIDNSECSKEKELTDDLIQIITVFANRLYGQHSKKTKRLINEVRNNADNKENQT